MQAPLRPLGVHEKREPALACVRCSYFDVYIMCRTPLVRINRRDRVAERSFVFVAAALASPVANTLYPEWTPHPHATQARLPAVSSESHPGLADHLVKSAFHQTGAPHLAPEAPPPLHTVSGCATPSAARHDVSDSSALVQQHQQQMAYANAGRLGAGRVEVSVVGSPEIFGGSMVSTASTMVSGKPALITIDSDDERLIERCDLGAPVKIAPPGPDAVLVAPSTLLEPSSRFSSAANVIGLNNSLCLPTTMPALLAQDSTRLTIEQALATSSPCGPASHSAGSPDSRRSSNESPGSEMAKRRGSFSIGNCAPPKKRFMQHHNEDTCEPTRTTPQRQSATAEPIGMAAHASLPISHEGNGVGPGGKTASDSAIAQSKSKDSKLKSTSGN